MDKINFRTRVLTRHLQVQDNHRVAITGATIFGSPCLGYTPPEQPFSFDAKSMRMLMDGHNLEERDWLFDLMMRSELFNPKSRGGKVFLVPDYNQSMQQQREITMERIQYLLDNGVFRGWLTGSGFADEMRKLALSEVRGIETVTTYDSKSGEFVINTPCESAQKYWIGGAANHATHAVVFSQLNIDGKNEGVHAFITQIRYEDGSICPNIRISDCGHKIGLNGVDNGRIWFDNVRIPRENLLNSVADVSPDGKYLSAIKDPGQRFGAFMAPLTSGRVTIAVNAIYSAKLNLAVAIRYSLTRRAFSITPDKAEVLLLDYPSHQRRLLPLLAKTSALSFSANYLKLLYIKRTPQLVKSIHVISSAFKAIMTWHYMRTLQECREACGGQGLKTENRVGQLKGEFDVQSTFEGDNNVLMQQVSKALLAEYVTVKKRNKPFKDLGLEHMNTSLPTAPLQLTVSTIRSTQFQNDVFCLRERDLLHRFSDEVSRYQAQGESKESAFIASYQLAEDLGRAFSDLMVLQTFVEAENNVTDVPLKSVLSLLRSMHVLVTLDEDAAFLRYGYLTVRKEVAKLCGEIRPHARLGQFFWYS